MKDILSERANLIDSAPENTLDNIANTRRKVREKAITTLTQSLDPELENHKVIFQTLPLEFLERGDLMGAIWYIETIGKLGNSISFEVLTQVVEKAISERIECEELNDDESLYAIDSSIFSLFRMAKNHSELGSYPNLNFLIGYYEESRGNSHEAITYYDRVIESGNVDGYLASARVYEQLGRYDSSEIMLSRGYGLYKDLRLLGLLVRALCKVGKMKEAYIQYAELKTQDKTIPPFIIYKGKIDNDTELKEVDSIIASYITEASFVPSEALAELSKSSTDYIKEQFTGINKRIGELNNKNSELWSDNDSIEYSELAFRRLMLMQTDILTLCNHRYIEYYLSDLKKFGIDGSAGMRALLADFFVSHTSDEVRQEMHMRRKKKSSDDDLAISLIEQTSDRSNTIFESISLHVSRIGELFSQPGFYDIQRDQISVILQLSALQEGDFDDKMESNIHNALHFLKNHADYFDNLRPSIRKNYIDFLQALDEKYGVFYRRHIQTLATDPTISTEQYPKMLDDYPDIALLFWIEKMIAGQFPTDDPEKIDFIVQKYSLDNVNIGNALLFGSLIFDVSIEYSIGFLADYPNMLDVPEAIYVVTEGLKTIDKKTRNMAIKDLHALTQERYGARGFFEHIRYTFGDIYKNDPSDEDIESMLLSSGNLAILQGKEQAQALLNFQIAGEEFSSIDGLLQAGDSYDNMGQYDKALDFYEQAFLQDDTIGNLTKILNCAICSGQFQKAQQYIDYGISKGYGIGNYILALNLWQGNTKTAFLQMIRMIKDKEAIMDMPVGLPKILFDTLDYTMKMPDSLDKETDVLKIYASFIFCNLILNGVPVELESYILHWQYINALSDSYEGELLHTIIEEALKPLTGELDTDKNSKKSPSDNSLVYLDTHATNIYTTYEKLVSETTDIEKQGNIKERMNDLCGIVILTLRKFPDSENLITEWGSRLKFSPISFLSSGTHAVQYTMRYQ